MKEKNKTSNYLPATYGQTYTRHVYLSKHRYTKYLVSVSSLTGQGQIWFLYCELSIYLHPACRKAWIHWEEVAERSKRCVFRCRNEIFLSTPFKFYSIKHMNYVKIISEQWMSSFSCVHSVRSVWMVSHLYLILLQVFEMQAAEETGELTD